MHFNIQQEKSILWGTEGEDFAGDCSLRFKGIRSPAADNGGELPVLQEFCVLVERTNGSKSFHTWRIGGRPKKWKLGLKEFDTLEETYKKDEMSELCAQLSNMYFALNAAVVCYAINISLLQRPVFP